MGEARRCVVVTKVRVHQLNDLEVGQLGTQGLGQGSGERFGGGPLEGRAGAGVWGLRREAEAGRYKGVVKWEARLRKVGRGHGLSWMILHLIVGGWWYKGYILTLVVNHVDGDRRGV